MVRLTDPPAMTIAVDLGRKATKPTNQRPGTVELAFLERLKNIHRLIIGELL